ncbi:MAG: HAMP domain-containing sensor histidine kinase, partial [Bacteroidota bacterium]
ETLLRYSKIELQRKNFQSALEHTQKAYDICNTHGILLLYHDVLVRFAECYLGLGKITQAEEFANTALENLGSKNSLLEKRNTFQVLSDINAAKKEYKSAHYYLQKTKEVQDTIHNEQAVFLSNRMAAKYDNEQKVSKIKELESDREYQKNWIVSLTIFLLSTSLLLIAIFCFYQRSKNLVRELNKKNKEITSQSEELQQLSQLKDKLFSTISHDLKNPIAHFEQGIQYLLSDELPKEEFLVFAKELKENATQLRKSVNKLMNWSYMQMVGLQPKATRNSLYKTAESSIDFYQKIGDDKRVTFKNNVPASLFVEFDEEHLGSIIRNLTSNAIKFSYQEGSIVFSAYQKENQIIFSIKDYGRGIEKEKLKEVFRAGFTTWGTDGEKGTGLGLALCKEFVEQNGGSIWVESDLGKGSTFFVAFPVITANTSPQSFALSKAAL